MIIEKSWLMHTLPSGSTVSKIDSNYIDAE
jgi:hypothetical protein